MHRRGGARRLRVQPLRGETYGRAKEGAPAMDGGTKGNGAAHELTLDEGVAMAIGLHRAGHAEQAEQIYRGVLACAPDHADALHFLGLLEHQRGAFDVALDLMARAIALSPNSSGWHNNMGNTLVRLGRAEAAEAAYRRSVELDPKGSDAYPGLQHLLEAQGRIAELVLLRAEWTVAQPGGRSPGALGRALARLGRLEEAAAVFGRWLEAEPDNAVARHLYLSCAGGAPPERASDDYVVRAFDQSAERFDEHLGRLGYRAPELVAREAQAVYGPPARRLKVLDAGCGTGLCGPLIAPYADRLTGVDLSGKMLEAAAKLGCYNDLVQAELTGFLEARAASYDLIICADTLCYFGPLDRIFVAARDDLRMGGHFIFTVEALPEGAVNGFSIEPSGRYRHHRDYIGQQAELAGFALRKLASEHLRMEGGHPVEGAVVTLKKIRAAGACPI
jgi:predicted TPR repeat methyltransferase